MLAVPTRIVLAVITEAAVMLLSPGELITRKQSYSELPLKNHP